MHNPALLSLAQELESALLRGDDTRSIRRQMSELSQRERTAAAKAEAKERALRAEAEAAEQAEIEAKATAVVDQIRARIAETLAPLALSSAQALRRYPDGSVQAVEINMEHEHG